MAYPLLLSPLRIGPIELRNRIVSTAHQTTLVEDGLPTDDFVAYHAARAEGGAGLICIEATAVHPSGLLTGHTIAGYDPRVVERLARVAEAVHAGGTRLFVQLFHGGREQIESPPRAPAVAPSAVPSQRFKVEPRALSSRRDRGDRCAPRAGGRPRARGRASTASSCAHRTDTCRRSS